MNEYFTNTSNPQPNSSGSSSLIRAEFASIKAGFDKLPTIAGNGGEFVRINAGATALETTGDVVASLTVAATGKTTPVDADLVPLVDSEASNVLKKLTWANLKATLKTYFDSVTTTLTNKTLTTPVLSNPSYSGTTANGGTVTTIDINGGTIDGAVIGGSSAAAGSFTTLNASGANEAVTSYGVSPLYLYCTTAFGIDVGPSLGFYGKADGGAATQFGNISARKENATSGNTAGYLSFATRVHGSTPTEKMRISSTGLVGIGVTPSASIGGGRELTVYGGVSIRGDSRYWYIDGKAGQDAMVIGLRASGDTVDTDAINIDSAGAVTIPGSVSTGTLSASGISQTGGATKNAYAPFKYFEGYAGSVSIYQTNLLNAGLWFNRYLDAAGNAKVYNTGATGFITFNNTVGIRLGADASAAADSTVPQTTLMDIKTDGTIALYGQTTVNVPAVLGYGTGAGGTVTQATSKSTPVTLNKPSGQITMHNAALAAGASVAVFVTNSYCTATSTVVVSMLEDGATNLESYLVQAAPYGSGGAFFLLVKNISGGSLSESLKVRFAIISGANA